ncbi:hypothetical protein BHE74_00019671 [Ensete ventricosum]|nr:hypothetical protein BHE74_00019671 [Ensete ventricosum]
MVGSATNPRAVRQVVFSVSADSNSGVSSDQTTVFAAVSSDGGSMAGTDFGCREDVQRLLAEKMKGKNKTDYKAAVKSYQNEREARIAAENSRDALSTDLERVTQEKKRISDQVHYSLE